MDSVRQKRLRWTSEGAAKPFWYRTEPQCCLVGGDASGRVYEVRGPVHRGIIWDTVPDAEIWGSASVPIPSARWSVAHDTEAVQLIAGLQFHSFTSDSIISRLSDLHQDRGH